MLLAKLTNSFRQHNYHVELVVNFRKWFKLHFESLKTKVIIPSYSDCILFVREYIHLVIRLKFQISKHT